MIQGSHATALGVGLMADPGLRLTGQSGRMVGHVYFWQGGSLWIGTGMGRTDWHDHHAHQISFSLGGTFQFRAHATQAWQDYVGSVVPSHQKHQFECDGQIAHVFIEPETVEGRALRARFTGSGITALAEPECRGTIAMLIDALQRSAGIDETISVARTAVAALVRASSPDAAVDARVIRVIEYLRSRVRHPSSLADAAAVAALSPGRFRHVFVEETGTSFRAYVLWLRLHAAIETAMAGESWTTAAHEAGFADSAHLTRTFKRMFGINPTTLVTS